MRGRLGRRSDSNEHVYVRAPAAAGGTARPRRSGGGRRGVGDGGRGPALRPSAAPRARAGGRHARHARLPRAAAGRQGGVVGAVAGPADPDARGRRVHGGRARVGGGERRAGGRHATLAAHRAAARGGLGPLRVPGQHRAQDEPSLQPHRARRAGAGRGGDGDGRGRGGGARGRRGHAGVRGALLAAAARAAAAAARRALAPRRRDALAAEQPRRRVAGDRAVGGARGVAPHAGGATRLRRGALHVLGRRLRGHRAPLRAPRRGTYGDAARRGDERRGRRGRGGRGARAQRAGSAVRAPLSCTPAPAA